jgi:DNA-binding transcriptional ArsR family regulator
MFMYERNMVDEAPIGMEEDRCAVRCVHKERIATARNNDLTAGEYEAMAALFKAMADPNRLKILWALHQGEMCVCDLASLLDCSESATSHQLRLLRQMHLVSNRRQGQILYYRLNDDHIHNLIQVALEHVRE